MDQDQPSQASEKKGVSRAFAPNPTYPSMSADVQRVLDKQMADKTKLTIKKLLKKIDADGSYTIKFDVFANLLELHHVKLSAKDLRTLRLESRAKPKVGTGDATDLIDYK